MEAAMSIYDFTARLNDGHERGFADFRGKVLLVVNVASKCGFTPQYKGLQDLYRLFAPRGFEILAFPCDQFGHQEPGLDAAIFTFCDRTYGVTSASYPSVAIDSHGRSPRPCSIKRWPTLHSG